jgi:hypothetical protein
VWWKVAVDLSEAEQVLDHPERHPAFEGYFNKSLAHNRAQEQQLRWITSEDVQWMQHYQQRRQQRLQQSMKADPSCR